ncbi:MAG TPA: hypothetical protein VM532_03435 [Burkholderiales bacterium]|jgi:hypothetical protein|nr:hypothetical protein [Burkholderiales bacterium]
MSDRLQYHVPGLFYGTVGSSMIAIAHLLAIPMANAAEAQRSTSRGVIIVECATATSNTQQSSTIKVGLLQEDVSTLISDAAKAAIGTTGLKRLENFFRLQAGWDGKGSKPIELKSVEVFSSFFAETGLRPNQLGVFMSAQGNVVVNWLDQEGQLVELEFLPSGVEYFIAKSGEEGTTMGDIGFSKLLNRLAEPVEA